MGFRRTWFKGKKTFDLDMLLRQTDAYFFIRKFGKIDATLNVIAMDVWNFPNAANRYNFIDTAGGIELFVVCDALGADQFVSITLLDTDGVQIEVPIFLNGQTPVQIGTPGTKYTRHQTSSLVTLQSNPVPGNVYIYSGTATLGVPDDDTQVYGYIAQGENRTQQGIYTIPSDCFGFFSDLYLYFVKQPSATSTFELFVSFPFGNGVPFDLTDFPSKQSDPSLQGTLLLSSNKPDFSREFKQSPELDPGTDLIFRQTASAAGATVANEYDIVCIKKEFFGLS